MRYKYLTVAELDQIEAASYYESQEPGIGAEFVEELDQISVASLTILMPGRPAQETREAARWSDSHTASFIELILAKF
jgi:hypothetical protein